MDKGPNRVMGLTLVELVVAMAVLALTVTIAIPAFQGVVERTRATSVYHQLTASLMLARGAAISRREPVVVCPSEDGLSCRGDAVWDHGWIVFADPGGTGQPLHAESILRRGEAPGGGLKVRGTRGRPLARYFPDGRAPGSNLTLRVCSPRDELLGRVVINNVGRARTDRTVIDGAC